MNILTFDIEDWYNCDFLTADLNWDKYEVRIYKGVERILKELEIRQLKVTFFCLGWIAEKHPEVIRNI
jgi:peptidoglycan/xylan/chitin deacetylase (PgdA/CDA1 family)